MKYKLESRDSFPLYKRLCSNVLHWLETWREREELAKNAGR